MDPNGTVGTAFPSGETGYASVSEDPLHTPNKYQPAPVGPPLLEANINYRVAATIWQTARAGLIRHHDLAHAPCLSS